MSGILYYHSNQFINITPFQDLAISRELQLAVAKMGFINSTTIQALAIPRLLANKDRQVNRTLHRFVKIFDL